MSEMLGRTWAFLTSSASGPQWSVPSNQPDSKSHLPHGSAQFMKALFDAPSGESQREIFRHQLSAVEAKLRETGPQPLKTTVLADCVVRVMVCHMFGCDPDWLQFATMYSLQLAQRGSVPEKKLGYLACTLLLDESDDLLLLLVNTVIKDLKSSSAVEVNMALVAASHLLTAPETAPLILPTVLDLAGSSKDFIRKKAVVCLQQIALRSPPPPTAPSTSSQVWLKVRSLLLDRDPGVVAAAVQAVNSILRARNRHGTGGQVASLSDADKDPLLRAVMSFQEQILDRKLPADEYNFRGVAAPWAQVENLSLLETVLRRPAKGGDSAGDPLRGNTDPGDCNSDLTLNLCKLLSRTMDEAASGETNGGQAMIVFQCLAVVASLKECHDEETLCRNCHRNISRFLQSKHNNVKYMGLWALEVMLSSCDTDSKLGQVFGRGGQHENLVIACLENPDITLRRKATLVLHVLANPTNVKSICDRLINLLRTAEDFMTTAHSDSNAAQRTDLIKRVLTMVDKFDGDAGLEWTVFTLTRLLQLCSDNQQAEQIMSRLKRSLSEPLQVGPVAQKECQQVGRKLSTMLRKTVSSQKEQSKPLPPRLLQLHLWCESRCLDFEEECPEEMEKVRLIQQALEQMVEISRFRAGSSPGSSSLSDVILWEACLNAIFYLTTSRPVQGMTIPESVLDFVGNMTSTSATDSSGSTGLNYPLYIDDSASLRNSDTRRATTTSRSYVVDLALETQFALDVLYSSSGGQERDLFRKKLMENVSTFDHDFTLTYLDEVVVEAIESGASKPYIPQHTSWDAPNFQTTPKKHFMASSSVVVNPLPHDGRHLLQEKSFMSSRRHSRRSSDISLFNPPVTWTLQGRVKQINEPEATLGGVAAKDLRQEASEQEKSFPNSDIDKNSTTTTESSMAASKALGMVGEAEEVGLDAIVAEELNAWS